MASPASVVAIAAVLGALLGAAIVFGAPRLAAYRFEAPIEFPSWRVLVPILGGKLAAWHPVRTPVIELITALTLAGLAVRYSGARLGLASAYAVLLIAIAYVDLDFRLVLNRLSYPGLVLALAGSALWPGMGLINGLIGAAVGLAIMGALELLGGGRLGTGDTKLAVLIGAMRGFPGVVSALLLGVTVGGLAAVVLLVVMRKNRKYRFAYAPYLAAGAILSLFLR